MDGDPNIKIGDALEYGLNAKNSETNNKGYSAMQIVYGVNPNVPVISNSTPASLETDFVNDDIKKHIMRTNMARMAFLEADNDDRLKRALSSRISSNNDEFFEPGDMISFKEENRTKWAGPAKIVAVDGSFTCQVWK